MSASKLILFLAAVPALAAAPELRWRAPVSVSAGAEFAVLELRADAYARTGSSFRDLRIAAPDGTAVPWAWRETDSAGEARSGNLADKLLDRVRTPGGALRFVLPLGTLNAPHHAILLDLPAARFQHPVTVETGANLQNWDEAARGAVVRLKLEGETLESLRVSYPPSTQPYVRVTIADWPEDGWLRGVEAISGKRAPEEWAALGRVERPARLALEDRRSRWELAFDFDRLDRARLALETAAPLFARHFEVRAAGDGERWISAGGGQLYRAGGSESLTLHLAGVNPRRLRLEVSDRDNPPLELAAVRLEAPVRRIIFPTRQAGRYWLYLGQPDAAMPDYDLPAILARAGPVQPAPALAGAWEPNPDYLPPQAPLSDRLPWLLPAALAAAVLVMGLLAFRLLRQTA
jgi:hypothetical protein